MKYPNKAKVIFSIRKSSYGDNKYREIFYKIKPSELSIFKRIFCNPWRRLYHSFRDFEDISFLYTPKQYDAEIKYLKTYGDISHYLSMQDIQNDRFMKVINEEKTRQIQNREIWPD